MWPLQSSWPLARRLCALSLLLRKKLVSATRHTAGTQNPSLSRCTFHPYASTTSGPAPTASAKERSSTSRSYPTEPRVGVGVVVFRSPPIQGQDPEILLIRRAKEPDKGRWCFPGGSLELGETLAACAAREVAEEAGLQLQGAPTPSMDTDGDTFDKGTTTRVADGAADSGSSNGGNVSNEARSEAGDGAGSGGVGGRSEPGQLMRPTPFAAVDVMRRDASGAVQFHYAVIEVAAVAADPDTAPQPGDDADGAQWVRVSSLRGMADLTVRCDEMAEEAARRFGAGAATSYDTPSSSS